MLPAGGNPIYYVEDMLGTSRVITTNAGVVCYDADFYPYGGERSYTNTCPQNYKFEGKERDSETGNDDFGARYYSNRFGRWLSADWSALPVAVPYANLTNPQTLNLYSMVADDPESFADLDGHDPQQSASGAESSLCGQHLDGCSQQQRDDLRVAEQAKLANDQKPPPQNQTGSAIKGLFEKDPGPPPPPPAPTPPPGADKKFAERYSGDATYYNLPGEKTASGQKFNPNKMAAAMTAEKADIGQTVTVRYTHTDKNGNTVTMTISVVVNDRGPFARNPNGTPIRPLAPDPRGVIDLTPKAFRTLTGGLGTGRVPVTVTVPNE